jgi:hypothetical protein
MTELESKRKLRRKETAEDFTPPELVSEMLDRLPEEVWYDPTKTFCDPAAGNGNFLVEVLRRKLAAGHDPLQALSTIYAVELMQDNTTEMKDRLLIELPSLDPDDAREARRIVEHNIKCHDALLWNFEEWRSNDQKAKELF